MKDFKKELSAKEINELDGFEQWQYYLLRALNAFVKKGMFDQENLPPPEDQLNSLIEKAAAHPDFKKEAAEFVDHLLELDRSNAITWNNCFSTTSSALLFLSIKNAGVQWKKDWEKLFVLDKENLAWVKPLVKALPLEINDDVLWELNPTLMLQKEYIELIPSSRHITRALQKLDKLRFEGKEPKEHSLAFEKRTYELAATQSIFSEGVKRFELERNVHQLQMSVYEGRLEKVKSLLEQGVSPNATITTNGNSSLHSFSEKTSVEIIELLLKYGGDLELKNGEKQTSLIALLYNFPRTNEDASKTALKLVEFLLEKGAILDWYEDTASTYASRSGYEKLGKLLESKKYYNSPLVEALEAGELNEYKKLVNSTMPLSVHAHDVLQGVMDDVDDNLAVEIAKECLPFIKDINRPMCEPQYTYLMSASYGKLKLMELLIDNGADVNYVSPIRRCAMDSAFYRNNLEAVRLLIQRGADIKGDKGTSYLLNVIADKHLALMNLLIESGVEINRVVDGITPLQAAVKSNNSKAIGLLVAAKADLNLKSDELDYPLVMAIKSGNCEIIHQLLLNGAETSIEIKKKITIADLGKTSKKEGVSELFILTPEQLKTYKPKKDGLVFANKRMLFAMGVENWSEEIKAQVTKVFGKKSAEKIQEDDLDGGDIEYVDVLDAETQKGIYQIMNFPYGDGALLSWNKTTVVGHIIQHGFELAKTMSEEAASNLHSMLEEANLEFGGLKQGIDFSES